MIYEGTYPSLIQGVSQQTPQERLDGQLGAQVNMLSDPVNGLRRRSGFKLHGHIKADANTKFDFVQLGGEYYIQAVTNAGRLILTRFSDMQVIHDGQYPYLAHGSKSTIRTAIANNQCYVLNTEKVPYKVPAAVTGEPMQPVDEGNLGWFTMLSGTVFNNDQGIRLSVSKDGMGTRTFIGFSGRGKTIGYAEVLDRLYQTILLDPVMMSYFNVTKVGYTLAFESKSHGSGVVTVSAAKVGSYYNTLTYLVSGNHRFNQRSDLPPKLPNSFDKYAPYVGGIRYIYKADRGIWEIFRDGALADVNPKGLGWVRIISGAFSKGYTLTITQGDIPTQTFTVTTSATVAAEASPEYVAQKLEAAMNANSVFTANYSVFRESTLLAVVANSTTEQLILNGLGGDTYITTSGAGYIPNKDTLPPVLPEALDGFIQAVGTDGNLAYFQFDYSRRVWKESGVYEPRYTIQNTPMYWYYDYNTNGVVVESLDIQGRNAGDDDNNPEPAFVDFGITGISSYQSRLILLSGSFVCMSKSNKPDIFMRTTVEEVLDDDPIEISATSLSNAQFEYAIPYNKDLVLFSQTQQAVIPANSTVLTPKTAVIYPSTQAEVSLAVKPTVSSRSLYYAYQRGTDYYQIGELIPNPYTDAQYNPQNLTDHLPLYATGVCTGMAGSSTNNAVMFSSDSTEVLINQFIWQGDTRSIMGFHKWVLPRKVLDVAFLQEYSILFVEDTTGETLVLTTNTQLNQLTTKPVPYLDIYQYIQTDADGYGEIPYVPEGQLVAVVYDELNYRHMEVKIESTDGNRIKVNHVGVVAIGLRYESSFTLTPPYLKDENGKVLAGVKSTVHSFPLTFRGTGNFEYAIHDFLGHVTTIGTSAATWSEVTLGYTWINSIGTTVIPCRSRLDGLTCTIRTVSTTDLNLTTSGYILRTARKHARTR